METGLNRGQKCSIGVTPNPKILDLVKARQDIPLHDSRIVAFEQFLFRTTEHELLRYKHTSYREVTKRNNQSNKKTKL